jgi:saccharopine dehydrogenase (NAD+, L-lysine-forming)
VRTEYKRHLWLRDEVKKGERRAAITPVVAKKLVDEGFLITVEKSTTRCFQDGDYVASGCRLAETATWKSAPKDAIIVGLKELPADNSDLTHQHVFFCHAFKNQGGWKEELQRFARGGGSLFDMEYLTFPNGRRVAAFGRAAGLAGAAVALMAWAAQQDGKVLAGPLEAWKSQLHMIANVKEALGARKPKAIVLGALGRSGRGAADVLDAVGCDVTRWDIAETKKGGPFPELLEYDILVNCILLVDKIEPFITNEMIAKSSKLSVICDVSCDTSNPNNPLPFLNQSSTLETPILKVNDKVQGITIDHLPTLVPVESSEGFSNDLYPHFLTIPKGDVWSRAGKLFQEKLKASGEN